MKIFTHKIWFPLSLVLAVSLFAEDLLTTLTDAEADALVAERVAKKEKALAEHIANTVPFVVLERREIDFDGRKLVSSRVADPDLPERAKGSSSTTRNDTSLPPEFYDDAVKENHTVSLSATVHEGEPTVTHLRWRIHGMTEDELEAWSNIDWRLMGALPGLETETDSYFTLLGVGPPSYGDEVPALPEFTGGKAEYFVFADSTAGADEKAFEVIDLLHHYYEANESELKIRHQRRQAIKEAEERYEAANPAKPEKAEIYFWKPDTD